MCSGQVPRNNSCSTKVFEKRSLTELICTLDIYFKSVHSSLTFLRCGKFKIKEPQFYRHNLYNKEMCLHISKNSNYPWFSSFMKWLIDYIRKWSNLTVKARRRKLRYFLISGLHRSKLSDSLPGHFSLKKKELRYLLAKGLCEHHGRSGHFGEETNLLACRESKDKFQGM